MRDAPQSAQVQGHARMKVAGSSARASGKTMLTPHLGYGLEETWRDFYARSIENALGRGPIRVLNAS